ncbi:glucosaminidase domain-containing protein [uncultured Vagococcus sp.]|uniref:glucosaminidase domain-containing protein n=1 Tax=uncultured Vagococcus sp. TaxID=189676 RepID=UPI00258B625F|nr:glucosaminidase domain-containing protein [uncultured Vagococcus sp.]
MKKIKHSFLLTLLLSSLGVQTTTALASTPTKEEIPSSEHVETEESTISSEEAEVPPEESETPIDSGTEESTTDSSVKPTEPSKPVEGVETSTSETTEEKLTKSKPTEKTPKVEEVVETNSVETIPYQVIEGKQLPSGTPFFIETNQSTQEFIQKIGEDARKIGQDNELYASVMIAQAILESASGQSGLASEPNYNLFGIKGAFEGQSVSFLTSEDNGSGELYSVQADFRKYPSYKESLEDYAELMTKGLEWDTNFYHGVSKKEASSYQEATQFLTGKYATDITYHNKLDGLIETYQLTTYDHPKLNATPKKVEGTDVYEVVNPMNNQTSQFTLPLDKGYSVSSPFGSRSGEHHDGIDLAVSSGTPIYSVSEGKVVSTGFDGSAGNYVIVQHSNGLYTNYFHMSQIEATTGQDVQTGSVLGCVGSTGHSTGPHLHFGISTGEWSNYLDPINYLLF